MRRAVRAVVGVAALACAAPGSWGQFAQFTIDAEHAAGQVGGAAFTDTPLRFTFLMDTRTGSAEFGGGGGSTIYDDVATTAWLDIGGQSLSRQGLARLFLTEDEGFDYLVADVFGLHATFWRNWTDGPFTDPSFEAPLGTVLLPGTYEPLLLDPRFGDVLPNRLSGVFDSPDGQVGVSSADIRRLTLTIVPSPAAGAPGLLAVCWWAGRRRRGAGAR